MSKSPQMQPTTQPAPNQRRPASVSGWLGGAETEEELPFSSSVLHYGGRPFLFYHLRVISIQTEILT